MSTDSGSGSRWEQRPAPGGEGDAGRQPTEEHPTAGLARPASPPDPETAQAVAPPPERGWRAVVPGRVVWLASGAAAVVFVVGGAGGFLVGHATAGGGQVGDRFGQQGPPGGFGPGRSGGPNGRLRGTPPRSGTGGGQGSSAPGSHT